MRGLACSILLVQLRWSYNYFYVGKAIAQDMNDKETAKGNMKENGCWVLRAEMTGNRL